MVDYWILRKTLGTALKHLSIVIPLTQNSSTHLEIRPKLKVSRRRFGNVTFSYNTRILHWSSPHSPGWTRKLRRQPKRRTAVTTMTENGKFRQEKTLLLCCFYLDDCVDCNYQLFRWIRQRARRQQNNWQTAVASTNTLTCISGAPPSSRISSK